MPTLVRQEDPLVSLTWSTAVDLYQPFPEISEVVSSTLEDLWNAGPERAAPSKLH
jgi:hypothetical protein